MNLYFQKPRIKFSALGEYFVRTTTFLTYALLAGLSAKLLISKTPNLKWLGVILLLFLIDRVIHSGQADKTVEEVKKKAQNKKSNVADALTPETQRLLNKAHRLTQKPDTNAHIQLLKELLKKGEVREAFKRAGTEPEKIEKEIQFLKNEKSSKPLSVEDLTKEAFRSAINTNEKFINPRNVLVGLMKTADDQTREILQNLELKPSDLNESILLTRFSSQSNRFLPESLSGFAHKPRKPRKRVTNRAWTATPTPYLDKFSRDLTALARTGRVGLLVGHETEFERLLSVLSRPDKPNALIYGRPGVGKTALINHLAYKITKDEVPENLFDKRLISLDIGALIANADQKEIAARLKKITNEVRKAGNVAIFIPDIHKLFKTTKSQKGMNVMDILLPIIKNAKLPFIAETSPTNLKKHIEGSSSFLEQFEKIKIEEVTEQEAIRILIYQSAVLEKKFNTTITLEAIKKSVNLSRKYLHQKPLPASAMDLLKQSLANAQRQGQETIKGSIVTETAEQLSKIPIKQAEDQEAEKLLELEKIIHEKFIDQDSAVESVADSLREYRSGLTEEGAPIATFLFVGPTGVGKTELSKQLARIQFGSKEAMIRLDMSEYQNKEAVSKLIGTPDGEKLGILTEAVLHQPYSLILLDEFEKAHPDILHLFLQVFDDGRLTDNLNRTIKFENTIIIATSNAHSKYIKEKIEKGEKPKEISEQIKDKLTDHFKPELLNRFTDIIVFKSLQQEEIAKIAKIKIEELKNQLLKKQNIELEVSDSAIKKLAEMGYSPVFGARPLENTISEQIKSELADKLLADKVNSGDAIKVEVKEGGFKFKKQ